MTSDEAAQKETRGSDDELDQAIDELRGVLKKGDDDADTTPMRRATDKPQGTTGKAQTTGKTDNMRNASSKLSDFGDMPLDGRTDPGPSASGAAGSGAQIDLIMDIPIDVQIVLGTSRMPVSALMNLSEGSTIPLARKIGEPVEVTVNGRVIGRGEITVLDEDDSRFGIRLIDLIKAPRS